MSKLARDDEENLIASSQRGDVQAFNQLVLRYQPILFGAVFRLLGDYDTAADVTQDAFLAAYRGIATYRGGSSFRAWLLRIGSNMACDYWRRVQRHPSDSLDALTAVDEPQSAEVLNALATSNTEDNPEERLLSQELQELIQRGIQRLPLDQRVAIVLCDIEGLSYEEVAAATQTTLGTVRSRIARGREKLRTYLSQYRELLPRDYRLSTKTSDN
jgi:RNA polymerase sigma-70 factor (ECF subfamily)